MRSCGYWTKTMPGDARPVREQEATGTWGNLSRRGHYRSLHWLPRLGWNSRRKRFLPLNFLCSVPRTCAHLHRARVFPLEENTTSTVPFYTLLCFYNIYVLSIYIAISTRRRREMWGRGVCGTPVFDRDVLAGHGQQEEGMIGQTG